MNNIPPRHVTAQVNEVVERLDSIHTEIEECLDNKYEAEADARAAAAEAGAGAAAEAAQYVDYEPDVEG